MARKPRIDVGDQFYHVLNRANARLKVFFTENDYRVFMTILKQGRDKFDMRIIAYCLMPNHFHLLLYPRSDGDMQKFMQWITVSHTQLWHKIYDTTGTGHLYQGRYKSFLVKDERHLLNEIAYIENNPVRAHLIENAVDWKFSSAKNRLNKQINFIDESPIELPKDYLLSADNPDWKIN